MRTYFLVDQERIKAKIEAGEPMGLIAREEGVALSVVLDIRNGKDRPVSFTQTKGKHRNRRKDKELCTCCEIRPKEDGFRYLCLHCWKYEDSGSIREHGFMRNMIDYGIASGYVAD